MKLLIIIMVLAGMIGIAGAVDIGNSDVNGVVIQHPSETSPFFTNNTNSSIYWGNYLWTDYDMPTIKSFAYNHTLIALTNVTNSYKRWFYNQTTPAINNITISYGRWFYNQSLAAINNITSSFGRWFYNQSIIYFADEVYINKNTSNAFVFNATKLFPTYYNATQSVAVAGTIDGGTLVNTQHADGLYDGVTFNFSEVSGSPGLDLRMNFTGITTFNSGVIRYKTSSLSGSVPIIQVWDTVENNWEDYPEVIQSPTFVIITQPVFDSSRHVDSNGVVQMRLFKSSNGNTNNHYYVDWLAIGKGFGVPAGVETDPLSIHKDGNISLTGNWNYGAFNINGSGNISSSDTGFFNFLGSSVTRIIKGWFIDINASRVNTTTLCLSGDCRNGWSTFNASYQNATTSWLGDGSDGVVVISANYTLNRTMYYENLTIDAEHRLTLINRDIFVRDTLTINGEIFGDGGQGNDPSVAPNGGAAGIGQAGAEEGAGTSGTAGASGGTGNGGIGATATSVNYDGGFGGRGGNGGNGTRGNGTVTAPPQGVPMPRRTFNVPGLTKYSGDLIRCGVGGTGGGGGGGDGSTAGGGGGGGGAGGSHIVIIARVVNITGNITSRGGDGGNGANGGGASNTGGGGGGAGGGGGCVYIFYQDNYYQTGIVNISGGEGGRLGFATLGGTPGINGANGQNGIAFAINLRTKQWTSLA